MRLTREQIDQTMAELHDGIRSLDIWDALWLMGVQAKQAIDLAAENERLKAKAKHYVCVRERNRETIDDLKGKLNAAESENERLKAKLNEIRAECAKPIMTTSDVFGGGAASGHNILKQNILAIIDKDGE